MFFQFKVIQSQIENKSPEVLDLKKIAGNLKNILGNECEANAVVDEQLKDFMECWNNMANDVQVKIGEV